MNGFEHENLDVYRVSIEFLVLADEVATALPKGRAHLVDQLRRASTSISLNIAEGAGEFSKADKARFYRIARRSSTECSAILDVCRVLQLTDEQKLSQGRELLVRIVAMLTSMVLRLKKKRSVAVVGPVTDDALWQPRYESRPEGIEDEGGFMLLTTRNPDSDRKTVAVCHGHDLGRFAASSSSNQSAPLFAPAWLPSMYTSVRSTFPMSRKCSPSPWRIRSRTPSRSHF